MEVNKSKNSKQLLLDAANSILCCTGEIGTEEHDLEFCAIFGVSLDVCA